MINSKGNQDSEWRLNDFRAIQIKSTLGIRTYVYLIAYVTSFLIVWKNLNASHFELSGILRKVISRDFAKSRVSAIL